MHRTYPSSERERKIGPSFFSFLVVAMHRTYWVRMRALICPWARRKTIRVSLFFLRLPPPPFDSYILRYSGTAFLSPYYYFFLFPVYLSHTVVFPFPSSLLGEEERTQKGRDGKSARQDKRKEERKKEREEGRGLPFRILLGGCVLKGRGRKRGKRGTDVKETKGASCVYLSLFLLLPRNGQSMRNAGGRRAIKKRRRRRDSCCARKKGDMDDNLIPVH